MNLADSDQNQILQEQLVVLYRLCGGEDKLSFINLFLKRHIKLFSNDENSQRAMCALRGLIHTNLLALTASELSKIIARGVPVGHQETDDMFEDILEHDGYHAPSSVGLEYLIVTEGSSMTRRLSGLKLLQELAAATLIGTYINVRRAESGADKAK